MESWDEIRTAYHVARLGTVSAAAGVLGVHHSTVIRHVDALEARLGIKLFQRHQRGYTPTEAGSELLRIAAATDDQFRQLITDERVLKLEYGEAHVAVRAGAQPQDPDNVVRHLARMPVAGYAHAAYLASRDVPEDNLAHHRFVGISGPSRAPASVWMRSHLPEAAISFRVSHQSGVLDAIHAGAGIGFLPVWCGRGEPGLVEVLAPRPEWSSDLWLVTHVDLHRSSKVQEFLHLVREAARTWPEG
ncbi:MAG: LysR family transcriptional regulator [Alphaproteobacteria bacterium HGW-Alphaproteobacteria-2]|nr:MAG: LysR family transcriptional regulator [Alphaproteobacteria bacterium HGW-Alphaproteobacteria-2]